MLNEIYLLSGIFFITFVALQLRSYVQLKKQTKLMAMQGEEIKKQMQELQQQNQLLEELNIEKQQIIGVVSHDLKGPFNRIFALVQLMSLSEDNFNDEQKEYLGKIHQIVADGLGMVRNLLDNRRFEDKGIELTVEKLDIASLISSLVKNYRILAEKKRSLIHFEAPWQLFLTTDKMCLTRIMDNLFSNALKFSPPEKNMYVKIQETDKFVEISVKDEGPGISLTDQHKLFLKYQRLTPRPTGGESSTGLGLYLVNAMVRKLEGDVFCESEVDKGATFVVRLKKPNEVIPEQRLKN